MREIESADISSLSDSSSAELLAELRTRASRWRLWPLALAIAVAAFCALTYYRMPDWVVVTELIVGLAITILAALADAWRKTCVVFFDLPSSHESAFERLHAAAGELMSCRRRWHIHAKGNVLDPKYQAGATSVLKRSDTTIARKSALRYVRTNVDTVAIGVGRQTLHFFPDRVLVYEGSKVGALSYSELDLRVHNGRFIEEERVPGDTQVIDTTWQYVNKNGGPDKRFKNNRKIPVCLYNYLHFTSNSGLNELLSFSRPDAADSFADAIAKLRAVLPR